MSQPPHVPPQQPYQTPPPQQPYQTPQPQPSLAPVMRAPKQKRFGWPTVIITALVSLGVGGIAGSASSSDGTTATGRAPTVATAEQSSEPAEEPTAEPTGYTPAKSDWVLRVKIKDKQCFGSAGCNVTAKITPYYTGAGSIETDLPDEGVIELTYKVTGDESGPITGTLEIDCADQTNEIGEESMSTRRSGTQVKATVTDVEYNEYG
jgi:hypothetical protein